MISGRFQALHLVQGRARQRKRLGGVLVWACARGDRGDVRGSCQLYVGEFDQGSLVGVWGKVAGSLLEELLAEDAGASRVTTMGLFLFVMRRKEAHQMAQTFDSEDEGHVEYMVGLLDLSKLMSFELQEVVVPCGLAPSASSRYTSGTGGFGAWQVVWIQRDWDGAISVYLWTCYSWRGGEQARCCC